MIQVVIDIPKEDYEYLKSHNKDGLYNAILNGTPLPKGHGRLIDADEIQFENTEFDTYGDYCRAFDAIDQAESIIAADTEVQDADSN